MKILTLIILIGFSESAFSAGDIQKLWNEAVLEMNKATSDQEVLKKWTQFESQLVLENPLGVQGDASVLPLHLKNIFAQLDFSHFQKSKCGGYKSYLSHYFDPKGGQSEAISPLIKQVKNVVIRLCG